MDVHFIVLVSRFRFSISVPWPTLFAAGFPINSAGYFVSLRCICATGDRNGTIVVIIVM